MDTAQERKAMTTEPKVLPPEIKADWVEALRSGKYEQGQMHFEYEGTFCCLGVLCKVLDAPTMIDNRSSNWDAIYPYLEVKQYTKLYEMNDGCGNEKAHTFAEIADHIEENL